MPKEITNLHDAMMEVTEKISDQLEAIQNSAAKLMTRLLVENIMERYDMADGTHIPIGINMEVQLGSRTDLHNIEVKAKVAKPRLEAQLEGGDADNDLPDRGMDAIMKSLMNGAAKSDDSQIRMIDLENFDVSDESVPKEVRQIISKLQEIKREIDEVKKNEEGNENKGE